jgi:hypothetical protein
MKEIEWNRLIGFNWDQDLDRDGVSSASAFFEHTSAIRPKCCAQIRLQLAPPSHTLIWNTRYEYGAVERSPVSVQFINASSIGTNQAMAECSRGASVSVALIVLQADVPPSPFDRSMGSKFTLDAPSLKFRRSGLSRPRTASTGLALHVG